MLGQEMPLRVTVAHLSMCHVTFSFVGEYPHAVKEVTYVALSALLSVKAG
jgi:hypothetical protein